VFPKRLMIHRRDASLSLRAFGKPKPADRNYVGPSPEARHTWWVQCGRRNLKSNDPSCPSEEILFGFHEYDN